MCIPRNFHIFNENSGFRYAGKNLIYLEILVILYNKTFNDVDIRRNDKN